MDDLNDLVWGSAPSPAKPQRSPSTTIPSFKPMSPALASTTPPRFVGSPAANGRQNSASNLGSFDPFDSLNLDLKSSSKQNDTAGLSLDEQRRRKLQQQPLQPALSPSSSSSLWGTPTSTTIQSAISPPTNSTNSSVQDLRSRFEPASPGSSAIRITPLPPPSQTSSSFSSQRSFAASPQQPGSILQPIPLYNNNNNNLASTTATIPDNDVFGQLLGTATGGTAWGAGRAAGSASLNSM
ncbi:hypothetical protein BC937DRAFT_87954 [Endogone sp. FLAS-F59071]|nr:hypothetical protein BC937DRAFT_87954 [Endogone sp. FLAS-F59071]|eukprot:RUS11204.1 hypothetical protein BC937DRAFT_87954 [Endogone sp. FLAS-F59071]